MTASTYEYHEGRGAVRQGQGYGVRLAGAEGTGKGYKSGVEKEKQKTEGKKVSVFQQRGP